MTGYEEYLYGLKQTNPNTRMRCRICDRLMVAFDLVTHVYEEHPQPRQEDDSNIIENME